MSNEHREQAREIVEQWIVSTHPNLLNLNGLNMPALIDRIASALSSRDTEVREVLTHLQTREGCWCECEHGHSSRCLAARDLYSKLQATELQEDKDG